MADRIFIVGLGSSGARHARNALALGCEVIGYDVAIPDWGCTATSRAQAENRIKDYQRRGIGLVATIDIGLENSPLGVIIATPPDTHAEIALRCRTFPLLIEKPLAEDSKTAHRIFGIESSRKPICVGYQFRFLPSLRDFRRQLVAGSVVQLLGGNFTFLSSEWCSRTYAADFLLELSHEFDATRFLYGNPTHMFCAELTRDRFQGSARFGDYRGVPSIDYDFDGSPERKGYIRHAKAITMGQDNLHWKFDVAENAQAYIAELQDFLAVCRGEKQPECTADDGLWALKMIEAIRKSDRTGKWEPV